MAPKFIQNFTTNGSGKPSMKRSLLIWTWLWSIFIVTIVIVTFLINPTEILASGMVGIATLIGIPLGASYTGTLFGEYNNRKDKELLSKLPDASIDS